MDHLDARPRRTSVRFRVAWTLFLVPFLFIGFMFFGFSYLVSPEPEIRIQPGVGVASVDGRDVALVPYERSGTRGMFQVMVRDLFQMRLAAVDAADGRTLWDVQLSDRLVWESSVLAAGKQYVYLATDSGPVVLNLRDGSVAARNDGITGLGGSFIAKRAAYGYDAQNHRVMAMNADGRVLAIPLDSLVAAPIDRDTAGWASALAPDRFLDPAKVTAAAGDLGSGERVELRERSAGVPGSALVRVAADGRATPVGDTVFHHAFVVLDGSSAAGAAAGHVLVTGDRSVNDTHTALRVVSVGSGAVIGSLDVASSPTATIALAGGGTAVATSYEIAVVTADGRVTPLTVGATDFFGNPS
ncbi:hypothetical protein F0L68_15250 [Solihabitans fulvus]|uniref:PQQ-like domain-containing protein n=1 Tax=Solihabitans fulvus TaxID=1892852 RepID=A0A5B2XFC7_9PSEU|nr:PA2928 family protein [Solihabitans fulvus]KAA2261769.1 hypothetical protein F0L68_15250 [Solihabitans fulvus]